MPTIVVELLRLSCPASPRGRVTGLRDTLGAHFRIDTVPERRVHIGTRTRTMHGMTAYSTIGGVFWTQPCLRLKVALSAMRGRPRYAHYCPTSLDSAQSPPPRSLHAALPTGPSLRSSNSPNAIAALHGQTLGPAAASWHRLPPTTHPVRPIHARTSSDKASEWRTIFSPCTVGLPATLVRSLHVTRRQQGRVLRQYPP